MPVSLRIIRPTRFKSINPDVTRQQARDGLRAYLEDIKKEMQSDYDRIPESESYSPRTKDLHDGWKVYVRSNNFGELLNGVKYAAYVQGRPEKQSKLMKRRGWQSISTVTRRKAKLFPEIMNRRIKTAIT